MWVSKGSRRWEYEECYPLLSSTKISSESTPSPVLPSSSTSYLYTFAIENNNKNLSLMLIFVPEWLVIRNLHTVALPFLYHSDSAVFFIFKFFLLILFLMVITMLLRVITVVKSSGMTTEETALQYLKDHSMEKKTHFFTLDQGHTETHSDIALGISLLIHDFTYKYPLQ